MKSPISNKELFRSAALFLLSIPPIEELPDELVDVTSRFRAGTINKCSALNYMEEVKSSFIEGWVRENERIHRELGSWNAI